MPGIDEFRHMAITGAERVVVAGDGVLDDASESVSWSSRAVRFITGLFSSATGQAEQRSMERQNRATVDSFNAALRSEYGEPIGSALARRADGHDLDALEIGQVLRSADTMRTADRRGLLNLGSAAAMLAAARAHPVRALAQDERDTVDLALDRVMSQVRLPEGPQGRLLAGHIRNSLEQLLPQMYALDATPDKHLLADLGTKLGERLNDYLLRALGQRMPAGASLEATVAALERGGGLAGLGARLVGHLDVEAQTFEQSMGVTLARVSADRAAIGGHLCGGAVPRGLTGLHITDSDPHKRGSRVCILTFDTGHKAVYKPRDVRIDEAISGRAPGAGPSLMEATSARIGGAPMPVYTFLPRGNDVDGRYGYVEHLSHGTPQDHTVAPEGARAFYRDMGRAAAITALAGSSDLHHENLMVSGGRPHFTDLEFAFGRGQLEDTASLLRGGAGSVTAGRVMGGQSLEMALTHAMDDNPTALPWRVEGDALVQFYPPSTDVPESLLAVRDGGGVRNNRQHDLFQDYSADFAQGFKEVLHAFRAHPGDYDAFVARCASYQVRYHPISTSDHRATFEVAKRSMHTADGGAATMTAGVTAMLGRHADGVAQRFDGYSEHARDLVQPMMAGYAVHDVPYFSREVGSRAVLRDGHQVLRADHFSHRADEPAQRVRAALGTLTGERVEQIGADLVTWLGTQHVLQGALIGPVQRDLLARIDGPF